MKKKSQLEKIFKERYPELIERAKISYDNECCSIEISFSNPRYYVWIMEEAGYIVGINFLHCHFDLDQDETNLEDAFEYFDSIVKDEIVAIGEKNKKENYIIATMEIEEGLKQYSSNESNIEIVSFNKEY